MLYQRMDSPWYIVVVCIFTVFSFISFRKAHIFLKERKKKKEQKEKTEQEEPRRKAKLNGLKKEIGKATWKVYIFVLIGVVCVFCSGIMLLLKIEYKKISKEFHPIKKYAQQNIEETSEELFKREIREVINQEEWSEKAVHLNWYYEEFSQKDNYITNVQIEEYQKKVNSIHKEMPYKEDMYIEDNNLEEIMGEDTKQRQITEEERLYAIFNEVVGTKIANRYSADLWEAHNAGKELFKKNNTSAMIFQTAVLAEGAHANLYKESRGDEISLQYIAGATECFEEFLKFSKRDPGDGSIISVSEVCFREGKMDYREGNYLKEIEKPIARHFLVKAYAEFKFALENSSMEGKYFAYLYYESLVCLRMMSYMEDEKIKSSLCQEIIEKWDVFIQYHNEDIKNMLVENISEEDVKVVRENLEGYVMDEN